ncbi:MAG TPA: DUF5327 family protein [Bacillota bacterium]|nr:DUF5327 family protein [Bacillota bacterium]
MAISNHTIITRMLHELHTLQENPSSDAELLKRVGNVKLMCELLLESETQDMGAHDVDLKQHTVSDEELIQTLKGTSKMTEEEYNVMIKGKDTSDKGNQTGVQKSVQGDICSDHDGANGTSIFDF